MEQMTPEERALVMAFAGPTVAELSRIENGTYDDDGDRKRPSVSAKDSIARTLQRDFGQPHRPQVPSDYNSMFIPPDIAGLDPAMFLPPSMPVHYPQPTSPMDNGQMEFSFDQSEQKKQTDLMETISKKLTKIIGLLESTQATGKKQEVVKLINEKRTNS